MNTSKVCIARRTMVLFFVVDTSGSMSGVKIGTLNDAIRETVPDIKSLSKTNADASIKIATLRFDTDCEWIYNKPVDSEDFVWNDLKVGGLTSFGLALDELNSKLSKTEFLEEAAGSFAPVIILLSDGYPTDEYTEALRNIQQNAWFEHAIKVAISIGRDTDKNMLAEFTGSSELVVEVHNREALKKIIRFASITSSMVNSKSTGVDDASKGEKLKKELKEYVDTTIIEDTDIDEF